VEQDQKNPPITAKKYKNYLEKFLLKNPKNIKARSHLAAMYLTLNMNKSLPVKLLRKALRQKLNDDDKVKLYVNLAYCYDQNYNYKLTKKY
jgi:hypothetical protein